MKKTILLFCILLASIPWVRAQCIVTAGDTVGVNCGDSIQLLASVTPAGIISPTTNTLNQIAFSDPEHGYIAGVNGTILRSTDFGQTWDLTTFLPEQNWTSVSFTSQSAGFVVSAGGKIAKTTDGGVSWNVIYENSSEQFTRVYFMDSNTGLAIGDQGLILKTTDGGNTWNHLSSGTTVRLNTIAFVNGSKGFIGGKYDYTQNTNILLMTSDAGDTWSNSYIYNDYIEVNCLAFSDEQTGYLSGNSYTYKTADGGSTWVPACWPADHSIALWNDSTGFLCFDNYIAKFSHSGTTQEIFWENYNVTLNDITCPDGQSVFTVGSKGFIKSYRPYTVVYQWEPSTGLSATNIPNPLAAPAEPTTYKVTVQLSNGNTCSDSVTVLIQTSSFWPKLCMVTVDSVTSHNRILWNKPLLATADSVYLYKEGNVSGQNIRLGAFPASQTGEYVDELSNAAVKADTYTITVLDKCSFESDPSSGHSNVHLSINQGIGTTWNLNWEQYHGTLVYTYNIYRWSAAANNQLIASVSGSISQYNDLNAPAGDINYMIEAVLDADCGTDNSTASSFSNIAWTNPSHGIGDDVSPNGFSVIQNPVSDAFMLDPDQLPEIRSVSLYSLNGKRIREWLRPVKPVFTISDIPSGLYMVKIETKRNACFMQKLMKTP